MPLSAPITAGGGVNEGEMLPNESRLSCGAELEGSQEEFYHTGSWDVHRDRRGRGAGSFKRVLDRACNPSFSIVLKDCQRTTTLRSITTKCGGAPKSSRFAA